MLVTQPTIAQIVTRTNLCLRTQYLYFNGLPPTKLYCVEPDSIWEMEEYHLHTPLL